MNKSFQFRIYPSKNQEVTLNRTLSTCRHLYNDSLEERKRQSELNRLCSNFQVFPWGKPEWITYKDQSDNLSTSKTQTQKEVFSQVLQDTLRRLDKTFKNFYRGFGYPRFRGMKRFNSFTYPQHGFELKKGKLSLSKIGSIRLFQHRDIEGKIKTCTIKKDVDQWYVVFTVDVENNAIQSPMVTTVGIDVGLKSLITLSNGRQIESPKFLRISEKKIIRVQRKISRKKKNSKNHNKQRIKVARVHRKIRNQRKDFAHKLSRELVNNHDLIAFENLNIRSMLQNHHLAKSIMDAGWYQLQTLTASKAEEAGKQCRFVVSNGTSQECHICGNIEHLTLADRVFECSRCGNIVDRDVNASKNIENRAVGRDTTEFTPVESTQKRLTESGSPVL